MKNYFRGVEDKPYHLSVGAILVNDAREIACHHFGDVRGFKDLYLLMRETMEVGESIEQALERGLMEEFGAAARLVTYFGSIIAPFDRGGVSVQKTTLYFLFGDPDVQIERRKPDDEERDSEIVWRTPEFLTQRMARQAARYGMPDLDESKAIERAMTFLLS